MYELTNFNTDDTPRSIVMNFYTDLAKSLRGGSYYVKRGIVNWVNYFSEDGKPPGISIVSDQGSLFDLPGLGANTKENLISFEMFARIPGKEEDQNMDEGLIDCFIQDAAYIISESQKRLSNQGKIIYRVEKSSAIFTERHDLTLGVQGIIVTFKINY